MDTRMTSTEVWGYVRVNNYSKLHRRNREGCRARIWSQVCPTAKLFLRSPCALHPWALSLGCWTRFSLSACWFIQSSLVLPCLLPSPFGLVDSIVSSVSHTWGTHSEFGTSLLSKSPVTGSNDSGISDVCESVPLLDRKGFTFHSNVLNATMPQPLGLALSKYYLGVYENGYLTPSIRLLLFQYWLT